MSNTMKRNHSQSPTDMPAMKKVRLELGRAAGFVDKDVVLNNSRQSSKSNATSPSRGLRHFSMKVCEKVEEKGTTSYNEVADEVSCMHDVMCCRCFIVRCSFIQTNTLFHIVSIPQLVRELKAADEKAALERGEPTPVIPEGKKNNDDKNIRRRVYDALNVLMAMDIITKDKKEITWRGLPGSQDGDGYLATGLSRNQRMQKLERERQARIKEVEKKRASLQELLVQNVCFQNLLGRNHGMEIQERQMAKTGSRPKVDKIPLPLIVVNTNSRAVVQCEMTPDRTNVNFDFSLPFEINDDNQILKRLGMDYASQETLQRSLPHDLFTYCYDSGIIDNITSQR